MSLGELQRKNERLITLTTNEIHRLESSFIPTPYRKQKTSIQKRTPYRHYLSTNSNATFFFFVNTAPGTHCCHLPRHLSELFFDAVDGGKVFFLKIRNACLLFPSPKLFLLSTDYYFPHSQFVPPRKTAPPFNFVYKYSFLIPPLMYIVAEIIPSSPIICE